MVTLLTPDEVFVPVASQLQGVMVRPLVPGEITVHSITGLLIGPGLAADELPTDLKETTGEMWHESSVPMVVDASALDWLPSGKIPDKSIRVITPHPGEAARLFNLSTDAVQADRVGRVVEGPDTRPNKKVQVKVLWDDRTAELEEQVEALCAWASQTNCSDTRVIPAAEIRDVARAAAMERGALCELLEIGRAHV